MGCTTEKAIPIDLEENLLSGEIYSPIDDDSAIGWRIGFDRRLEPKDDVRQIVSLANFLEKKTGLSFTVSIAIHDANIVNRICEDKVDLAVVGTVSYLQAYELCGARILVRGLNIDGHDTYRSAIVTAIDSDIKTINELEDHSFAFGAPNSTQGHLIPRIMFQQMNLKLENLRAFAYHESHASTANAIISGRFEAGAIQDTLARSLVNRGLVRILAFSDAYPSSGIIVSPKVPEKTLELIRAALVSINPQDEDFHLLYRWDRSEMPLGFVVAHDEDYDDFRQIAIEIGLLER